MNIDSYVLDIKECLGLNEREAWLIKMIVDIGPLYQTELYKRHNKNMTDMNKKNLIYSDSGSSKAFKKLIKKKHLLKPLDTFKNQPKNEKKQKKFKKIRYDINEEQLERIRKVTKKIETTHIVQIINKIPPFNSDDTESSKAREFFKKEKELYEKGKENYWESRKLLLTHNKKNLSLIQESYRKRLLGWSNYHIGYQKIPDPEGRSNNPYLRGLEAREAFIEVLRLAVSREDVDSVLSGLPLVYYFLCIEPEKAFKVAEEAEKKCWNKAPLYNSIALLKREEKKHIEALQYFSYAFKEGEKLQDYRTCGNALNNKARILKYSFFQYKELGVQRELLIELKKEILSQFEKSKEQYKKDEEVNGHSAKFHLEGIDKQIKELETT